MKNFRNLLVWQKGIKIVIAIYDITKKLPLSERYGLISQVQRASVSIPSNIAEGNSRVSDKELRRFLEISLGSCNELETLMIVIRELQLVNKDLTEKLLFQIEEEQKLLQSFINKL